MSKSHLIAAGLALALVVWVLGGYFVKSANTGPAEIPRATQEAAPMTVAVRTQSAKSVEQYIVAQGQAEPNRTVTIRAETTGRVEEILTPEGAPVAAGDVIARIQSDDREAKLARAKARLAEQEAAYQAAQALGKKGYQTQRQSDQIFTALQTAKAELEEARIELERVEIRAPFEGVVLTRPIELGDYLNVNGEVATVVDNDPIVVSLNINQLKVAGLKIGHTATVTFATGEQRSGKVRYIAARADQDTRTFRIEVEVPNPNREIPSGISAEAKIPTGAVLAHFVSPAAMSLSDEGKLGVKTVDEGDRVAFHEAKIVRSDVDGAWIVGLPSHVRIITLGQGFVKIGEKVQVAEENGAVISASPDKAAAFLPTGSLGGSSASQ